MKPKTGIVAAAIIGWAIATGIGSVWVADFTSRPGRTAAAPLDLKADDSNRATGLPRLIVFLHPYCPCSRATLAELDRLITGRAGLAKVDVYFYKPSGETDEWMQTDLWRQALEIPNVNVGIGSEQEVKKFGAITSGQALLYSSSGKLVFSGGITGERGHEGANAGRQSIETYLQTGRTSISETPVFGCVLTN